MFVRGLLACGVLAMDEHDNVYVVGTSSSRDFPTTRGVVQRDLKGARDSGKAKRSGVVFRRNALNVSQVLGAPELARMVISAGLTRWLLEKNT